MHRTVRLVALLALGSLLAACGGGGSSPSDPTPTMAIEAVVRNADGLATFIRLDLFYDNVRQGGGSSGTTGAVSSPPMHTTVPAPAGAHTLRATILEQTESPSRYTFSATGVRNGQTISLGSVTAAVATGGSLELAFTL